MALDIYTTVDLLPAVLTVKPQSYFWRDTFFGDVRQFASQAIAFEQLPTEQRLAPFVLPTAQGRIMRLKGRSSKMFTPPYVKPKFEVDPNMDIILQRGLNEPIGGLPGPSTLQERWDSTVAYTMQLGSDMVDRQEEVMCAQAVVNGGILIQGEDYPTTYLDFGRDPSLTTVLTGNAVWGGSAAAPLNNIRDKRRASFALSSRPTTDVIMGLDAFDRFYADSGVVTLLQQASNYNQTSNASKLSQFSDGSTPLEYRGRLQGANGQGGLNVWTYAQTYENYDGTTALTMNPLDVVGVATSVDGFMCYGAIKDADAGLMPMSRFPKMWKQPDPSMVFTMVQSAPLPIPTRVNASWRIRVG